MSDPGLTNHGRSDFGPLGVEEGFHTLTLMRSRILNGLRAATFLVFTLTAALCIAAPPGARINGRVVNAADGTPIEGAKVTIDLSPGDDRPEKEVQTDAFGFFEIKEIVPGDYQFKAAHPHFVGYEEKVTFASSAFTNKVIRLNPIDAKVFFDIYFQVRCLSTHATLSGAKIRAEYWKPDGNVGGAPDLVFNVAAGAAGDATLFGMEDGFYTFTVTRTGWDPITYKPPANSGFVTVGDKVRLIRYHYGSVFLRPIKQDLDVKVIGYDPVKDKPAQPLKGMTIKLTGIDLADDKLEIGPRQAALSAEDGTFKFGNLAPIRWKISVGRLGYVPKEVLVTPDATGALPAQTINVDLEPVQAYVELSSPYQTVDAVKDAKVQLQGIRNSNTEGINRELITKAGANGNIATVHFENLLPGRYWIRVQHEATIGGLPSRSGPLFGPNAFKVSFFGSSGITWLFFTG